MAQKKNEKFPVSRPRGSKRSAGATDAEGTPLAIRAKGMTVSEETDRHIRKRLGSGLGRYADRIERLTIRFEDVNGPRGGVDILCRAKVVLSSLPSVIVEERGETDREAFARVASSLTRAVRKTLDREPRARKGRARKVAGTGARLTPDQGPDEGSLIGRRVGRSQVNLDAALDRPEKRRRDQPVDTAAPGISASNRKAGYGSTARRNTRARTSSATATLEDSRRDRPSRKSTRKSANRAKSGTNLERKALAASVSPTARAARGKR
jgi:hypothetical protein